MHKSCHIYLFGDQTFDGSKELRDLVRFNSDPLVISFFEKTYYALRAEIGNLPQHQRQEYGRFSSFSELAAQNVARSLPPSLDQAMSCAYQLASFINEHGQDRSYPKATCSYIIGLCTGALAAAAVCSSTTFSNLLPAAVHSVVVAFRTGLCAVEVGRTIWSPSRGLTSDYWSVLCPGLALEEAHEVIKAFSESTYLPVTSQPFISASSNHGVTISGPPPVLLDMRKSQFLAKFNTTQLPIKVPYHAPHLFSDDDVESIISTTSPDRWAAHTAAIPTMSGANGEFVWAGNFRSLLRAAVNDILIKPLRWDKLSQRLSSIAGSAQGVPVIMHRIAVAADGGVHAVVKQRGCDAPLVQDQIRTLPEAGFSDSSALELHATAKASSSSSPTGRPDQSKIAIIGASGRFPDAEDLTLFWDLLYQGRDVHKVVPPLHWDAKTHVDPTGKSKNTSATPFGCWLDHPELFDAKFFNISPREAPQIDPAQRLALLTAYEAIEEAGIVAGATPSTQKDRVGVFYGVTSNDWMETNSAQNIDTYFIPGGNRAFIPGRINYFFNFSGPSYSVDTACSSSLAAIHIACNALWRGEIDTAIAGGTNVLTNPDFTAGLDKGHFLSRTGNCRTFDDGADGYCRGEGVATVILKRLEDAIADKDPIQAVILGGYTNHSAEAESITRPLVAAQKEIFRKVLSSAGVDPYDIGYVEMHGTGTQAGDAAEMRSVLETFAPDNARQKRNGEQALYVGSAKANIGHGEAASGAVSLTKLLLMLRMNMIPPHCGIKTKLNHTFPNDLQERRVFIASKPTPWKRPHNGVRRAFLNNFSAAGGNTALLLEDAPIETANESHDRRSNHLIAVSAKCAASLQGNVSALLSFLNNIRPEQLSHLSWTTTARRMHHPHRVMVYGNGIEMIKANLRQAFEAKEGVTRPKSAPKVLFAFTGQGAAYPGMGREFFEEFSSFRSDIHRFDLIARNLGFSSFKPFFTATGGVISEYTPLVSQLAIVCLEMALARLWKSWGIFPHAVVGHSLGEYAALNVAGVLSDSDTIYLVGKRAQLLQEHCLLSTHSMLAIRANLADIERSLAGKKYEISCINSAEDIVISGSGEEIRVAQQLLAASNVKASMLNIPYAFHSAQVDPILSELEQAAQGVSFHAPVIPVLSPLQASVVREKGVFGPKYLSQHCRKAVNMLGAIRAAQDSSVITEKTMAIEIGPQPVVSTMIKAAVPQVQALPSLKRKTDAWEVIVQTISTLYTAGADILWGEYHRDFKSSHKVLQLPAYRWDLKEYWMQYVNDWSLRKGDPPLVQHVPSQEAARTEPMFPRLESTTIHTIVEETVHENQGSIIVESDISRPDLNPMVQGHKVNGIPLCTPSVYADIALSFGEYLRARYWPQTRNHGIVISDMVIEKALIAAPRGPQLLRTIVELNQNQNCAKCRFLTVEASGKKKAQHAYCTIRFRDPDELQELQRQVPTVKARMRNMREGLATGKTYIFNKPMIYKMVGTLAQFDPNYMALDEIVLDSSAMEASSIVNFGTIKKEGRFNTNPAYIDALSQSAGFVMNANDRSNLDIEVFVNHGWKSFELFEELSPQKRYHTHVAMLEKSGKMWTGDVLVLEGDKVVASFKGIALQGVARRLLHYILSTESAAQSKAVEPAMNITQQPQERRKPSEGLNGSNVTTAKLTQEGREVPPRRTPGAANTVPPEAKRDSSTTKHDPADANKELGKFIMKALQIVSEESGIANEELTDSSVLADVGIDSLLSLMISSRFRDELAVDIDSALFYDLSTIKELKDFLTRTHSGSVMGITVEIGPMPNLEGKEKYRDSNELPDALHASSPTEKTQQLLSVPSLELDVKETSGTGEGLFAQVLQIISEETGIAVAEFADDTCFADVGVDSLLSLMIGSRLRDELDVQISTEALFTTFSTVRNLRTQLTPAEDKETGAVLIDSSSISIDSLTTNGDDGVSTDENDTEDDSLQEDYLEIPKPSTQPRRGTSIILQGRPWMNSKTLFLFPDGAGSATSYAKLPQIHPDMAVIGLNCPYVRHPQELTCSLDELMKSYLSEVRRRQPHGPYNFGGWSAGGILAYRATQILIQEGEKVENIVLIDSPVPKGLDRLPKRFYDHCNSIGLFGKAMPGSSPSPSAQLFAHFDATIEVLHNYHAGPLPRGQLRKTTIIWATECVMDGTNFPKLQPGPDDNEGMKFLTEKRTDFTAAGWDHLFPGVVVDVQRVEGAHHFSMMQEPHAHRLAETICSAIEL